MYKIIGADQKEYGPITAEQVREWITEGRLNAQSPIQKEGETSWKTLSSFPEFADIAPKTMPPAPAPMMASAAPVGSVPNYLVYSILCTLCCCLPFGIAAIVYSSQVNSKLLKGDYEGALAASKNAKLWCWLSFGFGIVVNILIFGLQIVATLAESHR